MVIIREDVHKKEKGDIHIKNLHIVVRTPLWFFYIIAD